MSWSDTRENELADMSTRLDLVILNEGNTTIFRRPGRRASILDGTVASPNIAADVRGWSVLDEYNASDHQYIQFSTGNTMTGGTRRIDERRRWNDRKLDEPKLIGFLKDQARLHNCIPADTRTDTENLVEKTMMAITATCNVSMPIRNTNVKRRPNYWWKEEISDLRKKCLALRRRTVRANRRRQAGQSDILFAEVDGAKKALKRAIKINKCQNWKNLCAELDNDPWGKAYQIAIKGLGKQGRGPTMEPVTVEKIIGDLFPQHPRRAPRENRAAVRIPLVTTTELQDAARTLKPGKAPGLDGIPVSAVKAIASTPNYSSPCITIALPQAPSAADGNVND